MSSPFAKHLPASLVAVLILLSSLSIAHAAGDHILVTIDATKQGKLKGDSTGKIAASAFSLESKSPRDMATGQASGRAQNLPVQITKPVDAASPQLFQALATNEVLKTVTIEFYQTNAAGENALTRTIRLTNAGIANLRQYMPDADDAASAASAPLQEDVSFSYQTIDFPGAGLPTLAKTPPAAAPGAAPAAAPTPTLTPAPGATPTLTRSPRLAPGVTPSLKPAPTPAPAPAPTATEAPATAPTLTRAQRERVRRAVQAATAPATAPAPTPAPTIEAKPAPATEPVPPASPPRKRR